VSGSGCIGIMGGTFDPVHYGHLVTAEEALVQFRLDTVVFMPTGSPQAKRHPVVTSARDRYLMTIIATASNPDFTVSSLEIEREGPTYTVETLRALRSEYGEDVKLFFITGADAVLDMLGWKDAEDLADLATFIAATRPGYHLDGLTAALASVARPPRVEPMEIPALAISSTDIRERVADGRPIRYLLPEPVAAYIAKNGLYRKAG
jgi:nicotinate-nucleotide adenylyltransferase